MATSNPPSIEPAATDMTSTPILPDTPSAAMQVYQNDLILDNICGGISSKATLKNLMVADKRCFVKAAAVMYGSVMQSVVDKLVKARCNLVSLDVRPRYSIG